MEVRDPVSPGPLYEVDVTAKERLAHAKAQHFTAASRTARIARALAVLREEPPAYLSQVSTAELVRLVEDPDLEYD
jgi:hypothetical protein